MQHHQMLFKPLAINSLCSDSFWYFCTVREKWTSIFCGRKKMWI